MSASNIARPVLAHLVPERCLDFDDSIDVIRDLNLDYFLGRAIDFIWNCGEGRDAGISLLTARMFLGHFQKSPRLCGQGKHVQKAIEKIDEILEGLSDE